MCKRSNAFSRPVLIIRGLDFENTTSRLWSFEGRARPRFDPDKFPVVIARGKHLFPFRTEKLSPSAPMVLGLRRPGRVGRRRDNYEKPFLRGGFSYVWRSPLSPSGDSAQYAATASALNSTRRPPAAPQLRRVVVPVPVSALVVEEPARRP